MDAITPAVLKPAATEIPDGIHFGLDEAAYHADAALGSTDLKRLAAEPAAYWFGSSLNPNRPEEEEDAAHRVLGRAVHKLVLEGAEAFHARFERQATGPDVLRTDDDLARFLVNECGVTKLPRSKTDKIQMIHDLRAAPLALPPILFDIEFEAFEAGRTIVKAADYDRITSAASAILDNPELAGSFQGGASEVSVFWTDTVDGEAVRRKARFDYLKPRAVVDLKSTRPMDGVSFVASCRRTLGQWNYPTQAAAYLQGRARLTEHVAAGRVFGEHDPAWLARVAAAEDHAFVFTFWASVGAPLTWGGVMSPGSAVVGVGEEYVRRALENFVTARRTYGDRPWIAHEPLAEIEFDHLPRWYGAAF